MARLTQCVWDNPAMSSSRSKASPQQVAKVLEILRSHPNGATIERITDLSDFTTDIVNDALHELEKERKVVTVDAIHGRSVVRCKEDADPGAGRE